MSSSHESKIECNSCDKIFSQNYDFEVHIKTDHKPREFHKCDHCDKEFILKWRLLKQKKNHDKTSIQKCHYFNNNLTCPFEEMGCMFVHEVSDMCKFDQKCTKNLYYYSHTKSIAEGPVDKKCDDDNETEESEVEACESCGEMFDEVEENRPW